MMSKLYNVYFIWNGKRNYEGTTDNFKLWLKKHNETREDKEFEDDFEVEEVCLALFSPEELYIKERNE